MADAGAGADLVVAGAELLVTMDDERREIPGGWVAITDGSVSAVGAGGTEPPAVVAAEAASILQPVSTASAPPIPAGPRVPDFHGKTVRAVLEEAMEFGIKVEIKGSGMARIQDPPAGSVLRPDDRVRVVFAR